MIREVFMFFQSVSKIAFFSIAAVFAFSCATQPQPEAVSQAETDAHTPPAPEPAHSPAEKSAAQRYIERIEGVTLSVAKSPKETAAQKPFLQPYIIRAEKNGESLAHFHISAYFLGSETPLETDENGEARYLPPVPSRAMLNIVSFFPSAIEGDMKKDFDLFIECTQRSVRAPYAVHTDKLAKGGVILVLDTDKNGFDENLPSGSLIQAALRQKGFTNIGNGPDFSDAVLSGDREKIYASAQSFLGKNYTGFLLYGTICQNAAETDENGYSVSVSAHIFCIDMKDGAPITALEFSTSGTGKTHAQALKTAREAVAKEIALGLYYNL